MEKEREREREVRAVGAWEEGTGSDGGGGEGGRGGRGVGVAKMALSKSHQHFGHLVQKFRSAECQGRGGGSYFLASPHKEGRVCANNIPCLLSHRSDLQSVCRYYHGGWGWRGGGGGAGGGGGEGVHRGSRVYPLTIICFALPVKSWSPPVRFVTGVLLPVKRSQRHRVRVTSGRIAREQRVNAKSTHESSTHELVN